MHLIYFWFLLAFSTLSSADDSQSKDNVAPGNDRFSELIDTIRKRNITIDYEERLKIEPRRKKNPKADYFRVYKYLLSERGQNRLERISRLVKNKLKIYADIRNVLWNATAQYTAQVGRYLQFIETMNPKNDDIDTEYVYLDMIETTNKILFHTGIMLISDIIDYCNVNISDVDPAKLSEIVQRETSEAKKEEMVFICKKVHICRHYPGYSDHFGSLLDTFVGLPENKFNEVIKLIDGFLRKDSKVFNKIMRPKTVTAIGLKLKLLSEDIHKLKEALSNCRNSIESSYKVFNAGPPKMLMKSKSLRILLDIIDKAFDENGEDVLDIEFDTIISLLKRWGGGYKYNIKSLIKDFHDGILHVINYVLDSRARGEVKVLIEMVYQGNVINNDIFNELFYKGSRYVRGEEIHNNEIHGITYIDKDFIS